MGDFGCGAISLDADGADEDVNPWGPAAEDIEHIAKGGTGGGGDESEDVWEWRDWLL